MANPGWYLTEAGSVATFSIRHRWEGVTGAKEANRILHETQRGVRYGYSLFNREIRSYEFCVPEEELTDFSALHDATDGDVTPFYFVPDTAVMGTTFYCRKEKDFAPDFMDVVLYNGSLQRRYKYTLTLTAEIPAVEVEP